VNEDDFEGTLVLEKLAEIGKVDSFFEAVDSDDFDRARALMKRARVDLETIEIVLKKMRDASGEH
jgi:iron uptake system EfeUOB component EfeO/EfeM